MIAPDSFACPSRPVCRCSTSTVPRSCRSTAPTGTCYQTWSTAPAPPSTTSSIEWALVSEVQESENPPDRGLSRCHVKVACCCSASAVSAVIFGKRSRLDRAMENRASFSAEEARRVGGEIGINWADAPFDVEQFRMGMDVELEHGLHDPVTNVTDSDPVITGKIALAHLKEFPDYSTRLARMDAEAEAELGGG